MISYQEYKEIIKTNPIGLSKGSELKQGNFFYYKGKNGNNDRVLYEEFGRYNQLIFSRDFISLEDLREYYNKKIKESRSR